MRSLVRLSLFVVLAAAFGCSGGGEKEHAADTAHDATHAPATPAPEPAPAADAAAGAEVSLAGTLGCGHCTFKTTSDCAAAVKTAEGEVYILDGVAEGSELWTARETGGEIALVGSVSEAEDHLKHVALTSFELK